MSSANAPGHTVIEASPRIYTIQGREVRLPVEVRDATAAVAYYLVSAAAAQRLVAPSGLRVAQVLPGRTLCSIGAMDYKDGDLGRYHEIAVTFFVHEKDERTLPYLGPTLGLLRGSLSTYIHRLPVDGAFTCEAGNTIWGFPKVVAEIALSTHDSMQTAVLRADGQDVLRQTMALGGSRAFGERAVVSYAYRDGTLYRTPSVMSGEGVGARLGGVDLELGPHPIADELRSLGLPKRAVFSTFISKMSGRFYAAERLETVRP